MAIDWTKPIETMYGEPAELLHDHRRSGGISADYKYVVLYGDEIQRTAFVNAEGKQLGCNEQFIRNVTPPVHTVWLNWGKVNQDGSLYVAGRYTTRADADAFAFDRVARTRHEIQEGRFDE